MKWLLPCVSIVAFSLLKGSVTQLPQAMPVLCRFIQYGSDVGSPLHLAPLALCMALPVVPRRHMAWGTGLALASTLGGILVPATVGAARALISGGMLAVRGVIFIEE